MPRVRNMLLLGFGFVFAVLLYASVSLASHANNTANRHQRAAAPQRSADRAGGTVSAADGSGCLWTHHPGTTLGDMLESKWDPCGNEGQPCTCTSTIRFGIDGSWTKFTASGTVTCNKEAAGGTDPVPGVMKRCECESAGKGAGTLAEAQKACLAEGRRCKGVSCQGEGGSQCSPRQGVPYLGGSKTENSWVKDCNVMDSRPGGGVKGKHRIDGEPTIFVSMAAYRDRDCNNTVDHLFKTAKFPRRVFVGVVCQKRDEDVPCVSPYTTCQTGAGFCVVDQVRQRVFPSSEAKGPTHARSIAASLYRGEDYFFMMDAHNRFVDDWDMKILEEHAKCEQTSEKCILSVYPMGVDISGPEPRPLGTPEGTPLGGYSSVAHLCNGEFHGDAVIKNARAQTNGQSYWPRPSIVTGAGLLFGPGRMLLECPFDPYIPYVWDGEEFLYNARLWTWGYDMYSPGQNILFHHYYRENQPRIWGEKSFAQQQGTDAQKISYKRLQYILGAPSEGSDTPMVPRDTTDPLIVKDLPKYGLGPYRSIDEYWKLARVDIRNRQGDPKLEYNGWFCKEYRESRGREDGPYPLPEGFTRPFKAL